MAPHDYGSLPASMGGVCSVLRLTRAASRRSPTDGERPAPVRSPACPRPALGSHIGDAHDGEIGKVRDEESQRSPDSGDELVTATLSWESLSPSTAAVVAIVWRGATRPSGRFIRSLTTRNASQGNGVRHHRWGNVVDPLKDGLTRPDLGRTGCCSVQATPRTRAGQGQPRLDSGR
jgi:hypothetical protein